MTYLPNELLKTRVLITVKTPMRYITPCNPLTSALLKDFGTD
jgi:hypothetical protein